MIERDLLVCKACGVVGPLLEEKARNGSADLDEVLGPVWVQAGRPHIPVAVTLSGGY